MMNSTIYTMHNLFMIADFTKFQFFNFKSQNQMDTKLKKTVDRVLRMSPGSDSFPYTCRDLERLRKRHLDSLPQRLPKFLRDSYFANDSVTYLKTPKLDGPIQIPSLYATSNNRDRQTDYIKGFRDEYFPEDILRECLDESDKGSSLLVKIRKNCSVICSKHLRLFKKTDIFQYCLYYANMDAVGCLEFKIPREKPSLLQCISDRDIFTSTGEILEIASNIAQDTLFVRTLYEINLLNRSGECIERIRKDSEIVCMKVNPFKKLDLMYVCFNGKTSSLFRRQQLGHSQKILQFNRLINAIEYKDINNFLVVTPCSLHLQDLRKPGTKEESSIYEIDDRLEARRIYDASWVRTDNFTTTPYFVLTTAETIDLMDIRCTKAPVASYRHMLEECPPTFINAYYLHPPSSNHIPVFLIIASSPHPKGTSIIIPLCLDGFEASSRLTKEDLCSSLLQESKASCKSRSHPSATMLFDSGKILACAQIRPHGVCPVRLQPGSQGFMHVDNKGGVAFEALTISNVQLEKRIRVSRIKLEGGLDKGVDLEGEYVFSVQSRKNCFIDSFKSNEETKNKSNLANLNQSMNQGDYQDLRLLDSEEQDQQKPRRFTAMEEKISRIADMRKFCKRVFDMAQGSLKGSSGNTGGSKVLKDAQAVAVEEEKNPGGILMGEESSQQVYYATSTIISKLIDQY